MDRADGGDELTMSTRLRTTAVVLVLTLTAILAACGSPGAPSAGSGPEAKPDDPVTATTAPPTYETRTLHETLADPSRPTDAGAQTPARPDRTLETTIVYPVGDGPFPLVVLAHGLTGNPSRHTDLASAWARAGFIVALPAFPLTTTATPGAVANYRDVANQPADVSFVIDQMLAAGASADSPLHGLVDAEHIGVAGHSLGAATAYAVTFDDCCRDPRIDAVVIMAGVLLVESGRMKLQQGTPILILHGDADEALDHQFDVDIYASLAPPKWFITLLGASHAPPYENTPSPYDTVVEQSTTDFWQGELGGDPEALTRLADDAVEPGVSTLQSDPG